LAVGDRELLDVERVRSRIERVASEEAEVTAEIARDVAFHMTDWLDDLETFFQFCQEPEAQSSEEVNELLIQFLVHVPNHLAAAAKLYTEMPVTDIFGVGATSE
jgi:hypothetical protein